MPTPDISIGSRVVIVEAQIEGIVIERTEFIDGAVRWAVQYWNEGKRETVNCESRELEVKNADA